MDPAACRATLGRLIDQETGAVTELMSLLEREHEHLLANDVVALREAMRTRQQCVSRILRVDEERRRLCRSLGKPNSLAGLTQLMYWCDPQRTLAAAWQRCAETAARAQQLNDRNGMLVGVRLKHVRDRLGALLEGRRSSHTYGRKGGLPSLDSGRILAAEA